jgi:hypothetical protein
MMTPRDLLTPLLRSADAPLPGSPADWELLIRQARRSNLLTSLATRLRKQGRLDQVLPAARTHFDDALLIGAAQGRAVRWEAREIAHALRHLDAPVVLLKGAAYLLDGLPAADGRVFADVDLLVPRAALDIAELMLGVAGWVSGKQDAYDQRYYREWMHEIPPMVHGQRETLIDLHHNILPLTSRVRVDADRLLEAIVPLPHWPGLYRLGDADLVLHSASHLFLDGEFDKGLRDLVDLDALLRHFSSTTPGFWSALVERAQTLGLARVLFYALRYAQAVLGTPVPAETAQALAGAAPPRLLLAWMDAVFLRALRPDHPSCEDGFSGRARSFLYLRAHWMRMPLHLLLPHLVVKAWKRRFDDDENEAPEPNAAPR